MNDNIKSIVITLALAAATIAITAGFISFKTEQMNDVVYVGSVQEFELQKITHWVLSVETIAIVQLDSGKTVLITKETGALKIETGMKVYWREPFNKYVVEACIKRYC